MNRKSVLISSPNTYNSLVYLPVVWALLKESCDQDSDLKQQLDWLTPIVLQDQPETLLEPYENRSIDVLGLSCYVWNFELNIQLARLVKKRNPLCKVIAGGPHVAYSDSGLFNKFPELDILVQGEGELVFRQVMQALVHGEDLRKIPNLFVAPEMKITGHLKRREDLTTSAILANQFELLSLCTEVRAKIPDARFALPIDGDRGCPYGCTYCDWGSATLSKIRRAAKARTLAEIEWAARHRINVIELTNANFGITEEDLEIVLYMEEQRNRFGYPKSFHYSMAKAHAPRSFEISKVCARSELCEYHALPIQTTNPEALTATARKNLPPDQLRWLVKELHSQNIPIVTELIVGLPGDNFTGLRNTFAELAEAGVYDHQVYLFCLLPNAPANDPVYRAKWNIQTVTRHTFVGRRKLKARGMHSPIEVCVETAGYSREEFVQMLFYSTMINVMQARGFTREISQYLRFEKNISYLDFYGDLFANFITNPSFPFVHSAFIPAREHLANFADPSGDREKTFEEMDLSSHPDFNDLDFMLYPEEYLNFLFLKYRESFWKELKTYLRERYSDTALMDLCDYIKFRAPHMDDIHTAARKSAEFHWDWPAYFEMIKAACHQGNISRALRKTLTLQRPNRLAGSSKPSAEQFIHLFVPGRFASCLVCLEEIISPESSNSRCSDRAENAPKSESPEFQSAEL